MQYFYSLFVFILLIISQFAFGQKEINIKNSNEFSFELRQSKKEGLRIKQKVGSFKIATDELKGGKYSEIRTKNLMKTFRKGYPNLPVISKLIEIPIGSDVKIEILSYDIKEVDLKERGIDSKLAPAQPSKHKSNDKKNERFYYNEEVYKTNEFFGDELVKVEESGIMRNKRFGRLQISPLEYNPVKNKLRIYTNLEFEVNFSGADKSKTKGTNKKYASPYFEEVYSKAVNYESSESKDLADNSPITYVIVSDRMFEDQLQPFIEWKELKGYNVIEAYTDDIGSTTDEIKSYLEDLYNNPDPTPPSFVLFVGDVEQIPAWSGNTGDHVTDLPYCEYTGDNLPEVYYGRFSAQTKAQLQPQIDKTLNYEKYKMTDPDYLNQTLLVAGDDEEYEDTYGNGTMWYADNYYFNTENGINSHLFLQDPPNGNVAVHDSIIKNVNSGVGYANYTGHCSSIGWSEPSFSISEVEGLTNEGKYGLWVGNCCLSVKFDNDECFGEAALRAENKGAIGDIGGSNYTYWDEDYWWGVGNHSTPDSEPSYEETGRGIYDAMFHTKANEENDPSTWYITQGQAVVAGNMAVEASSSNKKEYYWEIYHLMGDPSLMPYLGEPEPMTVSTTPSKLIVGMDSLIINTEPHAYAALSFNGKLLDATKVGETGEDTLTFESLTSVGEADLVVTAQNKQPHIGTITIAPSNEPYVNLDSLSLKDGAGNDNGKADYGESVSLDVQLANVSDSYEAFSVMDTLTTDDSYISLSDSTQDYGDIPAGADSLIEGAFNVTINDSVPDQHNADFTMQITGSDASDDNYMWKSDFSITLKAPQLKVGSLTVVDTSSGNGDNILDPGETADLIVEVTNTGHSDISGVEGTLNTSAPELTINTGSDGPYSIAQGTSDSLIFNVSADGSTPPGTPVNVKIDVAGDDNNYTEDSVKRVVIGGMPEYLISDEGTVTTCLGHFYDSGGPNGEYNNEEDYTITFKPESSGKGIKADFLNFDVEQDYGGCYDELRIYDGPDIQSELIGVYCNENPPATVTTTNSGGALTFEFSSDYSVTRDGWEAEISCFESNKVTFKVTDGPDPVENAEVSCAGVTVITDSKGKAVFNLREDTYDYTVSKTGYTGVSGSINVKSEMTEDITIDPFLFDVEFKIYPKGDTSKTIDSEVTFKDTSLKVTGGSYTFENIEYSGYIDYEVNAGDCHPESDSILLNSDTTLNIGIRCNTYHIIIHVENELGKSLSEATVELEDMKKQTNTSGNADFTELYKGTYKYYAEKEGYSSDNQEILVKRDSTYVISLQPETDSGVLLREDLKIYPNPAGERLVVEKSGNESIEYELLDMTGKIVQNGSLKLPINTIDISSHPAGIYFIRVIKDEKFIQDKIIIE